MDAIILTILSLSVEGLESISLSDYLSVKLIFITHNSNDTNFHVHKSVIVNFFKYGIYVLIYFITQMLHSSHIKWGMTRRTKFQKYSIKQETIFRFFRFLFICLSFLYRLFSL